MVNTQTPIRKWERRRAQEHTHPGNPRAGTRHVRGTRLARERSPAQIPALLAPCLSFPTRDWASRSQPLPCSSPGPLAQPPLHPKKHRQQLCPAEEHPHPTSPSPLELGTGVCAALLPTSIFL